MEEKVMYKKILLPTDGSVNAEKGVRHGIKLAKMVNAGVLGVHVIDTSLLDYIKEQKTHEKVKALMRGEGEKMLSMLRELAQKEGIEAKTVLREGRPYSEIVKLAEEEKTDLIAMSPASKSEISKAVLGSVSDKVVSMASCSVIIVK